MAVYLNLFLYGKPGQELDEGGEVTAEQLRNLSKNLQARLEIAANVVEKLTAAGWEAQMGLYDIFLANPYVKTATHAEEKLHDLGINPDDVYIEELEDEEEEEEMDEE